MVKLFVVEDEATFAKFIRQSVQQLENVDVTVFESGSECLKNLHLNPDIISIDFNLPDITGLELLKKIKSYNQDIAVIMLSGQQNVEVVVQAYRNGAQDYIIKNPNAIVDLINSIKNISSAVLLKQEVEKLREQIIDRNKYSFIIGNSEPLLRSLKMIQKVEKSTLTVLINGENGTGKELVAKALHYNSPRRKKPLVTINMAAIPKDLIENELFGHEKGAFTDARDKRIGKFEEANEGTLFMDEIGEMPMDVQTKLLRVLETKEISRIGSNKIIPLDVRFIAATNKNLAEAVQKGDFRIDLFYRLQGFIIQLPPLRERGDDILLLARHFLQEFCKASHLPEITISKDVLRALMEYPWPGNVRELKSVIERAALLTDNNIISLEDIIFPMPDTILK